MEAINLQLCSDVMEDQVTLIEAFWLSPLWSGVAPPELLGRMILLVNQAQ